MNPYLKMGNNDWHNDYMNFTKDNHILWSEGNTTKRWYFP
ncbi:hypothetical protein KX01_1835 [Francisella frigiditurris]|uniref:Uncharacterized protein n=1 Tax=Francisella frigiditurris TaxID=1542390 RepID=A0A1J0KTK4_9GAMM|nr:hypothetical protein KX01_1835 [Francisella frigiditurris]